MDDLKHKNRLGIKVVYYYIILFSSNSFLSYFQAQPLIKGWVFILGVLFPCLFFYYQNEGAEEKEFFQNELGIIPGSTSIYIILGFLAVILRFYKLTSFHLWPTGDEGLHGYLAIPLTQKWNWQFFYTVGEHPPLLIWILAFFYKEVESPFFNLWFFPAIFSFLAVPAGYWAVRQFFSKSLSILFTFLMAFSFWPLVFGRFCHQGVFVPFWELLSFLFLALWIKNKNKKSENIWAISLGFWSGLGTLTFPSWFFLIFIILVTVFILFSLKLGKSVYLFLSSFFIGIAPFGLAVIKEGYGHHLLDSSGISESFINGQHWITHLSYLATIFWGPLQNGISYGPIWGGMLNPAISTCFFIGLIDLLKIREKKVTLWILFSIGVCLLPAFLASDYVELNRLIQTLPFLLFLTAIGLHRLFIISRGKKYYFLPFFFLIISVFFDVDHLCKAADWGDRVKIGNNNEQYRIYQALKEEVEKKGPGLIFTDFLTLDRGHTLSATTYAINAAVNPSLNRDKAQWAGLITNLYYLPFLAREFPDSRWIYFKDGSLSPAGELMLGIIQRDGNNYAIFNRWCNAHDYFRRLNLDAERSFNGKEFYLKAVQDLGEGRSFVKNDRFLESSFWEWSAQYYFDPQYAGNVQAIKQAIEKGYPAAHLYYRLGTYLEKQNKPLEARKIFSLADSQRALLIQNWGGLGPNVLQK